jgi:hypothetical protein
MIAAMKTTILAAIFGGIQEVFLPTGLGLAAI